MNARKRCSMWATINETELSVCLYKYSPVFPSLEGAPSSMKEGMEVATKFFPYCHRCLVTTPVKMPAADNLIPREGGWCTSHLWHMLSNVILIQWRGSSWSGFPFSRESRWLLYHRRGNVTGGSRECSTQGPEISCRKNRRKTTPTTINLLDGSTNLSATGLKSSISIRLPQYAEANVGVAQALH